ncbi:MAG: hypothetical protein GY763_10730 [Gammaproteobacteria bacterium]|nr:hypothetical protein [Gammaproteobacteria bacterium]
MSVSNELMYAILAMDSYNRGYGAGINVSGPQIGTAVIGDDSLILNSDPNDPNRVDEAVDFYAATYNYNGQTVISYRGTDDRTSDIDYGYAIGFGLPGGAQDTMALQFYKQVAGKESMGEDPRESNIGAEITGTATEIT